MLNPNDWPIDPLFYIYEKEKVSNLPEAEWRTIWAVWKESRRTILYMDIYPRFRKYFSAKETVR